MEFQRSSDLKRRWLSSVIALLMAAGISMLSAPPLFGQEGDHTTAAALEKELVTKLGLGECRPAIELGGRAVDLRRHVAGAELDLAESLDLLGHSFMGCKDFAGARSAYSEAQEIRRTSVGEESLEYADSLLNIGAVLYELQKYDDAEITVSKAVRIRERKVGMSDLQVAQALSSLSVILVAEHKVNEAELAAARALEIRKAQLSPDDPNLARSMNNLAGVLLDRRDFSRAAGLFRQAYVILRQKIPSTSPLIGMTMNNLASALENTGDCNSALEARRELARIDDWALATNLLSSSEGEKLRFVTDLRWELASIVSLANRCASQAPQTVAFAAETTLNRKGVVFDALVNEYGLIRRALPKENQEDLDRWKQALTALARYPLAPTKDQDKAKLADLTKSLEDSQRALAQVSARYQGFAVPVTLAGLRDALPAHSAFVDFVQYHPKELRGSTLPGADKKGAKWGEARYAAFIVTKDHQAVYCDLGLAKSIDSRVRELLDVMHSDRDPYRPVLRELRERVADPIERYFGGAKTLIISPDGDLNFLPFGALMDAAGNYFLEKYDLQYVSSGREFLRLRNVEHRHAAPVIFAGINYSSVGRMDATGGEWKDLPGSLEEGRFVASTIGGELLTGAQASEEAFRRIGRPSVIHVATHGFSVGRHLEPTDPDSAAASQRALLRSGIVLARTGDNAERDGILTGLEIAGLDLEGTQLVVLSACDTGLGRVEDWEGVFGLRRAFFAAGVNSIVVSLWRAREDATIALMREFYKRLKAGMSKAQALRAAKLSLVRGTGTRFANPRFWAGFVLVGDPSPLEFQR